MQNKGVDAQRVALLPYFNSGHFERELRKSLTILVSFFEGFGDFGWSGGKFAITVRHRRGS